MSVSFDGDSEPGGVEDTELVRLEPSQTFGSTYTFSVVPKRKGLRSSDVWNLLAGKTYELTLRKQCWWWMFEDEMTENCDVEERREMLGRRDPSEWKPECSATFEFTE